MIGRKPGLLRTEREQRARQAAEEIGFGACRGERKADAARGLDDTDGDFQETKTQRHELGGGQFPGLGNGVAHGINREESSSLPNGPSWTPMAPCLQRKWAMLIPSFGGIS